MILAHLLFAHLLADFVFQPERLVKWKMRSIWGTIVHVVIHFFTNLIVLLPFLLNGYLWLIYMILGICIIHFCIDEAKINYDLKHDKKVKPFLVDQLLHLLTILVANIFLIDTNFILPNKLFYRIYLNPSILIFLSFLVVVTIAVEIYNFQKIREKNHKAKITFDGMQMLSRVIVFAVVYAFFMLLTFYLSGL